MEDFTPYRDRNALAVCAYSIFGASVAPSALNLIPLPFPLETIPIFGHTVAVLLVIGCGGAVWGMFRRNVDKSLLTEQLFSGFLCLALILYSGAIARAYWLIRPDHLRWYEVRWISGGVYQIGMCLGIAVFCVWRFVQIRRYLQRRTRTAVV